MRVTNAAIRTAARTVTAPESSLTRFCHRDRLTDDDDAGQYRGTAADPGDDVVAVAAQFHRGTSRSQDARRDDPDPVAPSGQPGSLPGRVHTTDLHGNRCDAGDAKQQHRNKTRDRQGGLHRAEALITG